jgi:hypothetical protein
MQEATCSKATVQAAAVSAEQLADVMFTASMCKCIISVTLGLTQSAIPKDDDANGYGCGHAAGDECGGLLSNATCQQRVNQDAPTILQATAQAQPLSR